MSKWIDCPRCGECVGLIGRGLQALGINLHSCPKPQPPLREGEIVLMRSVVARADETSFMPASGWHSKDLIVRRLGMNGDTESL